MKKIPLVFSGCLLGLVGAGNLLADSLPFLAHAFSLTGLFFWFFFLVYHAIRWQETKIELQQPALLSGMATFPMAEMILSTYLFRLFRLWRSISVGLVVSLSLGSRLNSLFYQDPCHGASKSQCYSELDRSLCGHCSSSLDLPRCRNQRDCLSRFSDWFWFDLSSLSPYLS